MGKEGACGFARLGHAVQLLEDAEARGLHDGNFAESGLVIALGMARQGGEAGLVYPDVGGLQIGVARCSRIQPAAIAFVTRR